MRRTTALLLVFATTATWSSTLLASGSYRARPTRPGASVSAARYHLGKKILKQKVELGDADPDTLGEQKQILVAYQKKLRKRARVPDLSPLAGKLSEEQLDALRYYLEIRFKVKVKKEDVVRESRDEKPPANETEPPADKDSKDATQQ